MHPVKRFRPIASGAVPENLARAAAIGNRNGASYSESVRDARGDSVALVHAPGADVTSNDAHGGTPNVRVVAQSRH